MCARSPLLSSLPQRQYSFIRVFHHSSSSKLKYFNKPTSKKSHMLSALRSAFTENTRSSVGLNDLGAAAAAEEEASLGEDGARIVGRGGHSIGERTYVKLSEVVSGSSEKAPSSSSSSSLNTTRTNTNHRGEMGEFHASKGSARGEQHHPMESPVSKRPPTYVQLVAAIVGYSLCNSQLLIINKITLAYIPAPCFLLFCQLLASGVAVRALAAFRVLVADRLEYEKAKGFLIVVFTFVTTLFANMKSIQLAPVDTFICLRSTTPLILAVLDYFFLGRDLPSAKSFASLIGIAMGVVMYVNIDSNFSVQAYLWIVVWYVVSIFEIIYVKHLVSSIAMTTWGQTYYQNILSVPFLLMMFILLGERQVLENIEWTFGAVFFILLSCVAGLGMSFLSFHLRDMISATSFAIVGNMCKVATILVNTFIWDQHSSPTGILSLFICLGSGAMYSQAPMRDPSKSYAEREVLPCLSRQSYRWIVLQTGGKFMAICMGVLIAMCVILICIALSLEGNEVAVGTTNPFARGRNKMG